MRYIAIVHFDPAILNAMPTAERQDVDRQTGAINKEMEEAGILVHAEAIQEGHTAKLVRVRNGKTIVTDGPYIETKEQMAGFVLFEARDLNEAIAWQDRDPLCAIGTIEIRPIYEIPTPP